MNEIEFNIIWRNPKYPVIVVSDKWLYSAFDIKQLAISCMSSVPIEGNTYVQVIDSTGEEFWYSPENYALTPGFSFKKWTKKRIIEAFNNSINVKDFLQEYSLKSLSSKRLDKIISDICKLLRQ